MKAVIKIYVLIQYWFENIGAKYCTYSTYTNLSLDFIRIEIQKRYTSNKITMSEHHHLSFSMYLKLSDFVHLYVVKTNYISSTQWRSIVTYALQLLKDRLMSC